MRKALTVFQILVGTLLLPAAEVGAADRFLLRTTDAVRVCDAYDLIVVQRLAPSLFLVQPPDGAAAADVMSDVAQDEAVQGVERESRAEVAEVLSQVNLSDSTVVSEGEFDRTPVDFVGDRAWLGYVHQPSVEAVGADRVRLGDDGRTGGNAKVAIIDTGIDPEHRVLKGWLIDAYDFTRNRPGASEWIDLPQSTAAILDQSTAAILDPWSRPVILNQSTAAILDDDTASALEETAPLPTAFGHGTMVAGLVHLIAPEAKIMPLKAFSAHGFSTTGAIARAIYYVVEKGADVINMSFTLSGPSQEIERAIKNCHCSRCRLCRQPATVVPIPWPIRRHIRTCWCRLDDRSRYQCCSRILAPTW